MPMAPLARAIWCGIALSSCIGHVVRAEDESEETEEGWLPDSLEVGGEIEVAWERHRNFDLDHEEDDDTHLLGAELQLELIYDPNDHVLGVVQTRLQQEWEWLDEGGSDRKTDLLLEQAYLTLSEPDWGASLQMGRQRFEDVRQWWYDADLDGVRAHYVAGRLRIEASASREALVQKSLLQQTEDRRVDNYILHGRYVTDEALVIGAYGIVSDDREDDGGRPIFLGLQAFGTIADRLTYWADAVLVRGEAEGRDLHGQGLDLLGAYRFDLPLGPRLIAGYAFGSGDSDPDDDRDGTFRQTGLQSNETDLGGLVSYRYYGEAFDPELGNMTILTAGVGLSPIERVSLDLLYHDYRQDQASDEIGESAFDAEPTGERRHLGRELDLVVGAQPLEDLEVNGFLGYFKPGGAFGDDADDALFVRLEVLYDF